MSVYVFARMKVKSEKRQEFLAAIEKLVNASRDDHGCIQYDLHQSATDSSTYYMNEIWENKGALDSHSQQSHFNKFIESSKDLLAKEVDIFVSTKLDV